MCQEFCFAQMKTIACGWWVQVSCVVIRRSQTDRGFICSNEEAAPVCCGEGERKHFWFPEPSALKPSLMVMRPWTSPKEQDLKHKLLKVKTSIIEEELKVEPFILCDCRGASDVWLSRCFQNTRFQNSSWRFSCLFQQPLYRVVICL